MVVDPDPDFSEAVRRLRASGSSPKEIARALGARPAAVTDIVRRIASERAASAPARLSCLVSPGWDVGLSFEGHPEWPSDRGATVPASGLVAVLVAREERYDHFRVASYLLDVYCLGVKDAGAGRGMHRRDLTDFTRAFFDAWDEPAVEVPADLARDLVFGAADYADSLGFAPHADFARARRQLEPWSGPSSITFGCDGSPCYTQGPYDDVEHVLRTLDGAVGRNGYHFSVSVPIETFEPRSPLGVRGGRMSRFKAS